MTTLRLILTVCLLGILAALTGCATTPSVAAATSRITYVRQGQDVTFTYDTPKDNAIRQFELKRDPVSGEMVLRWEYSGSAVNADAVQAAHADALARARLVEILAQTVPAALGRTLPATP